MLQTFPASSSLTLPVAGSRGKAHAGPQGGRQEVIVGQCQKRITFWALTEKRSVKWKKLQRTAAALMILVSALMVSTAGLMDRSVKCSSSTSSGHYRVILQDLAGTKWKNSADKRTRKKRTRFCSVHGLFYEAGRVTRPLVLELSYWNSLSLGKNSICLKAYELRKANCRAMKSQSKARKEKPIPGIHLSRLRLKFSIGWCKVT